MSVRMGRLLTRFKSSRPDVISKTLQISVISLYFWGSGVHCPRFFEIRKVCCLMTSDVMLRDVSETDLEIFFDHQRDPAANHMAAFTAKDPADRTAHSQMGQNTWRRFHHETDYFV